MDRIVVVGASLAGLSAARTLRREGYEGELTLVGAETHLPYDRPPLSKGFLQGARSEMDLQLLREGEYDGLGVTWSLGHTASGLDVERRRVTLDNGDELPYDGLVLATGSIARRIAGTDGLGRVHVLRTLGDAVTLRADLQEGAERVAVVGSGFIGGEVAASCVAMELPVTVIEAARVPLVRAVGERVGQVCADLHRDHGVDLRLGVGVAALDADGDGRVERVVLSDGTVVDADVVVVGIGVRPATDWLEDSGLTIDDGVVCDETCLAAPGVVAAGDVARWPNPLFGEVMRVEHWENAVEQGAHAARRLLLGPDAGPFAPVPWFWSDQYDRKIQMVGRAGRDEEVEVVMGSVAERRFVATYGRDGQLIGAFAMNRPRQIVQLRGVIAERGTVDDARAVVGA
ncbi:MAG: FAD-dependent oxidoreductase [Actinomycetota bacterium]|nr:FAD-dependent oxidoreductase [Actinomycetota bacterium]